MENMLEEEPKLDKARHIKYWLRCLKTLLPHHYTGNESNRMYLAFFIISALDLLSAWESSTTASERSEYIDWIYHCQHPRGGFRMWPGTDFGIQSSPENERWDPANIPATYFALSALLIAGDDLSRVRRRETLQWLTKMQREDGSFGETLVDGTIEGGRDPRFGYCATGIRFILRGGREGALSTAGEEIEDIRLDSLVSCIEAAESYEGGLSDSRYHEPHAGYTYCALGCLNFIERLKSIFPPSKHSTNTKPCGPSDPALTLSWLVARQTDLDDPDGELDSCTEDTTSLPDPTVDAPALKQDDARAETETTLHQSPDKSTLTSASLFPTPSLPPLSAGMNGRTNKVADTCYAWWVGASISLLTQAPSPRATQRPPNHMFGAPALQTYLLSKTQHPALGGFGKFPGDLPDLYHSYMGLAALGLIGTEGIKSVDAGMCISAEAEQRVHGLWKEGSSAV
ncbi:unnamed protein product [Zymoseptoria tritici ST99CH_3D1]|nr:unnamed protein product [Zymoseptoria tritici ST99CH_3D1]